VSTFTYDPEGNRLSYGDGNGNTTSYAYDPLNRLMTVTDSLGKTTITQYDPVGNPLNSTDRNGNATVWTYDADNRRIAATDALGNTTLSQYDPVGNLTEVTDANLHSTQYAYDTVNRLATETYADGATREFTYDGVGNVLTRKDEIGQVTNYAYSDLYFLLSRTYPSAVNDTFTYDLSGRLLSGKRGSWPITFTYDSANRVTQTLQNGHTIGYVYNLPGRTRSATYPGGRSLTEHTDARTRLDYIDDAGSPPPIVQYTYDPGNRVVSRAYRNGTSAAFTYDANNWTTGLQHTFGATLIASFSYTYDNEGNKQFEQKLHDPAHSEAYQYDTTYRLIDYSVGTLVSSSVPVPSTQTSYSLDPVGNWNSKTTNGVTQTRAYNSTNELIEINSTSLTYDANGNVVNDGSNTYAYDEENRLTQVTRNSDSAVVGKYQYDALSRRVQKIADPAGTSVTTHFFYDDARVIEEQDGAGSTQATYVYGNYIDEVLTMNRAGQTYYYHQNALWSVEAITDSTAKPVERYSYDAYGLAAVTDGSFNPISQNSWGTPHSAIGNPWMFAGRQLDEETGLYYYRARYYDPNKGRFMQRDPLEYVDGMNVFEYVSSRPTYSADPTGTDRLPLDKNLEMIENRSRLDRSLELMGSARIRQLIEQLDDDNFFVREKASEALKKEIELDLDSSLWLARIQLGPNFPFSFEDLAHLSEEYKERTVALLKLSLAGGCTVEQNDRIKKLLEKHRDLLRERAKKENAPAVGELIKQLGKPASVVQLQFTFDKLSSLKFRDNTDGVKELLEEALKKEKLSDDQRRLITHLLEGTIPDW
jgi:RHS repeat-associated protein